MERVLEPELMEDAAQALAYEAADFSDADALFIARIRLAVGEAAADAPARVADLGCGPGGQTLALARAFPRWSFEAVDGAEEMAARARAGVATAGLEARIRVICGRLPDLLDAPDSPLQGPFDLVLSSSMLHHLPEPQVLWQSARRLLRPGGGLVVLDLRRPDDDAAARALVASVAGDAPPILQADFFHSLCAALRPDELVAMLRADGLGHLRVAPVGGRHLALWGQP